MKRYSVESITYDECKEWLLYKHYAKRMCSISYSFGLFINGVCEGICTFGKPASPSLCNGICGVEFSSFVYELNRLVVNEGLPKNTLSRFVSKCLKELPELVIVSYADTAMNHNGYIYQATNWIYTGKTKERTDIGSEDGTHSRHYNKGEMERKFRSSKHRYVFFTKNKKKWIKRLNYEVHTYPKGENKRYDATYKPHTQTKLF